MKKIIQFGERVEGYNIPVLNEREVRASAGLLFLATFISMMFVIFRENFIPIKYVITFFFTDFLIRVFISPRFSPSLIIGRYIVSKQNPEYVGAAQKKFAWTIGLILSGIMFFFFNVVNAYSPITGIICLICLALLFSEAAFGICWGCKIYSLFYKEKAQYCPGEVCEVKDRQEIQKISKDQLIALTCFVLFVIVIVYLCKDKFEIMPYDLLGIDTKK